LAQNCTERKQIRPFAEIAMKGVAARSCNMRLARSLPLPELLLFSLRSYRIKMQLFNGSHDELQSYTVVSILMGLV
jgi:hypothetical protein